MRRQLFHFDLPEHLIAKKPTERRSGSRLLLLEGVSGRVGHQQFCDVESLLDPGDLLVLNNTRVIPARLFGTKETGGKVEILVERLLDNQDVLAHIRASKSPKAGVMLQLDSGVRLEVLGREGDLFRVAFCGDESPIDVLEREGHMPLPPYIDRADTIDDRSRYQTVYAQVPGAVAAPTAGLHFDDGLLKKLKGKGVNIAQVTLHVGAGTFQPVRVDNILEHQMHSEILDVSESVVEQVRATKAAGKRVIAVGTTSVRCLETAARTGEIVPIRGETDIFIYPGYQFKVVDALITNFHLPESTLMMLVSALGGYSNIMEAYRQAVDQKYRFFSYGDAMFITRNPNASKEIPE